jgi:Fic family protein
MYDRNQPYNQLPELPPADQNVLTINVLLALNRANKALAELKGLARKLPNQSMLVNTIALREAKTSTEIENIFTTDDELYKALHIEGAEVKGNAKEVLFYRDALWAGYKEIKERGILDRESVIKIYQEIKQVNDGIRPPQTETVIKKMGSSLINGAVIYTPPRGVNVINQKLDNLFEYINDDKNFDYDPLIKLAISHYQYEAIHPFRDGNGRSGRIISILLLIQKGLLDLPILYLSAYIIKHKADYYELLDAVTTRQKWENWIIFMLKAIEETSVYTINKIIEIDRLFDTTFTLIGKNVPKLRKENIEKLFEQPYISPKKLMGQNIKSLNTAKKYLLKLEQLGIVVSTKIGKEVVYLNVDLYNILSES